MSHISNKDRFRRSTSILALLAVGSLSGYAVYVPAHAQATAEHTAPIDVSHPAAQALPGFADLVQKVSPAVVTISSTMRQQQTSGDDDQSASPFPPGSPQDHMFGQFFGSQQPQAPQTVHAVGSGFIVEADGRIVTNNHVIKDATDIQVTLADGRKMPAKVIGVDAKTDLAVLQVKSSTPLPHLALGDSDAVRVGDWVVAVGNPFGLGGTVTAGILSARGRQIGEGPYDDFLQIDAPINRGNSGGPLFAQDGTVIGVNTAIYSPSGGSVGIGFAIPSSVVKQVVSQLEASGKVARGYVGVSAQTLSPAMATALHLPDTNGALVAQVQPDSPAAAAGLEPGDVIIKIGQQTIKDPHDLARTVAAIRSGTTQDVVVHRNGQDKTISVTIAPLPGQDEVRQASGGSEHGIQLGLTLAPLDQRIRESLNLQPGQKGVAVTRVQTGSPAEAAGLLAGDVLESVGGAPVTSPQQALGALRDATREPGSAVALRVLREGQQAFVAMGTSLPSED
jgi:serine protease Do